MRRPRTGSGFALVWVILALLLAIVLVGILWTQGADSRGRTLRELLSTRVQLLGKGGFAHGLHKVERTTIYFDRHLKKGRRRMDVGQEDPGYLADLKGEVEYQNGKGSYRVIGMAVERQETVKGESALKVEMLVDALIEVGEQRRRERIKGEFRLFRSQKAKKS